MDSGETTDPLLPFRAALLAVAGVALLLYGGYGVLQGTGALVWFVPRLTRGALVVAAVSAPWMVGGALLWAAGGWAIRDAWKRRLPSRRLFGTTATGMVLASATGLLWWGWLPFAMLGEDPVGFAEAGWFIHWQFASAVIAALGYFAWSRRLPHAPEGFGATAGRLTVVVVMLFGAVALWMREPAGEAGPVYEGKTALEWGQACQIPGPESMDAYTRLSRMGPDGEAGWRWLFRHEASLGGSFSSVWVVWLKRQKSSVRWYDELFLDDGLAEIGSYAIGGLASPSPASVRMLRDALQPSRWGISTRQAHRDAARTALLAMGPAARVAFWDLLAIAEREVDEAQNDTPRELTLRELGRVGLDADDPRRPEAMRRLTSLYRRADDKLVFEAARAVVEMDAGGADGTAALAWLAEHAVSPQPWQFRAAEQLEELGPLSAPAADRLVTALRPHLSELRLPFDFGEHPVDAFDARCVWSAILASGAREQITAIVLEALQHPDPGPRLAAAMGLLNGEVDYAAVREPLWAQLEAKNVVLRTSGAWAIAVSEEVPDDRLDRLVRAVDWSSVTNLLPELTHPQRTRVLNLLERALTSEDEESSRVAADHYPEIHERAAELKAEDDGVER